MLGAEREKMSLFKTFDLKMLSNHPQLRESFMGESSG